MIYRRVLDEFLVVVITPSARGTRAHVEIVRPDRAPWTWAPESSSGTLLLFHDPVAMRRQLLSCSGVD